MNANNLIPILTLILALGAGAAVAAIKYGQVAPVSTAPLVAACVSTIPRVVVTASRSQVAEFPVARVVVVGHRAHAGQVVATSN
ncbi:MAG: hypothetical protein D4R74_01070 [Betaproteobacteria bacterium]|nr:MAG: hypothetical protein D4R74_01070 [Betaproteobacteria bacterium]